jgi:hypothetical protein
MAEIRTTKDVGKLHELLLKACPPCVLVEDELIGEHWVEVEENDERGVKSITVLAGLLGLSRWSVHKWAKTEHITPKRAKQVVEVCKGRIALDDLSPFFYN